MGIVKKLFNSTRKPEGLLGELMVKSMNKGHAAVSDWGMEHITKLHPSKIIDLGCGGGRNAAELLKRFPAATVHALDYSEISVQKTKQFNQQAIKNGRLQVTHANVLNLLLTQTLLIWLQHLKLYISGRDLLRVLNRCTESSKKVAGF